MIILGIHGGFTINQHEPSAALMIDGKVTAVCEEERYLRIKSCYGLMPVNAIDRCLSIAGIAMEDVDTIVVTGSTYNDREAAIAELIRHHWGVVPRIELVHHQHAHLAAAFYGSGAEQALCLSLDATGDGSSGMIAHADRSSGIKIIRDMENNSLGFFYTMITYFLGFIDGDEYKVMGLAPYGKPDIDLSAILQVTPDGWWFDRAFLRSEPKVQSPFEPGYAPALAEYLGRGNRTGREPVEAFHQDLAASAQAALEEAILSLLKHESAKAPHLKTLCYAGGVALNCSANSKIVKSGLFDDIYVPPIASDRGLSLGCAYLGAVEAGDEVFPIDSAYYGDSYSQDDARRELESNGCRYEEVADPASAAADALAKGKIIGWHQGRSEMGARALGNRSILAKPGGVEMRDRVNARIKFREKFRPFAPAALESEADKLFDTQGKASPYMCITYDALDDSGDALGAVVHVDGTARLQTVGEDQNPILHQLILNMQDRTDVPVVLNTSFNLKGQPIVETPRDSLMTFYGCGLDELYIGNFRITK